MFAYLPIVMLAGEKKVLGSIINFSAANMELEGEGKKWKRIIISKLTAIEINS